MRVVAYGKDNTDIIVLLKSVFRYASREYHIKNVLDGIVMGKLGNFYKANCLVEQPYVKDDKLTVGQYRKACSKELGGKFNVVDFKIFEKGEGLQKREDNFAEEIAKLTGKQ